MPTTVEPKQKTDPTVAAETAPAPRSRMPSQRLLAILAGLVAVIALVAWMVTSSSRRKEEFGNRALLSARSAAEQGNLPLAATEFQKVIDTYRGSDAAQAAVIGLNQVRMVNGQSDLAAANLREFLASNPDPRFAAPAHGMLAAALENAGRPADAAASYQRASDVATVDYLKAEYLVDAGRALLAAGRRAEAEQAYRTVVTRFPETAALTEAKVRLSELTEGKI
jgi:tetratricopeptide (TPR) repeat protein